MFFCTFLIFFFIWLGFSGLLVHYYNWTDKRFLRINILYTSDTTTSENVPTQTEFWNVFLSVTKSPLYWQSITKIHQNFCVTCCKGVRNCLLSRKNSRSRQNALLLGNYATKFFMITHEIPRLVNSKFPLMSLGFEGIRCSETLKTSSNQDKTVLFLWFRFNTFISTNFVLKRFGQITSQFCARNENDSFIPRFWIIN